MSILIQNADDLKVEISRLRNQEAEQSAALKARFSSPTAIVGTLMSAFPKSPVADGVKNASFFNQDLLGLVSRIALPLTLNKTLFKHSNFLVKTLVGILSQKASHYISEDAVGGVWDKAKGIFNKVFHKKEEEQKAPVPAYVKP